MTAKELIEHLNNVAPNQDVLLLYVSKDETHRVFHEIKAVRAQVDWNHAGARDTTYLVAGDEMEE